MTSNPAFERDAAKARRPSTLRYAPFVLSVRIFVEHDQPLK